MGVISWIVIGLLAGWLAGRITESSHGLMRNIAVGLIGAVLGGFLARRLGIEVVHDFRGELIVAIVGAFIFLSSGRRFGAPDGPVAGERPGS